MYPQVIEESRAYGQLSGNRNESDFASAMEQGFRSAGWKGALTKGIEARQAQRKTGYSSAYDIANLYAELGEKDQAFRWLNTDYKERDVGLVSLKTVFLLDPLRSDPRFAEWWDCRSRRPSKLFSRLCKDADPDIPILKEAIAEHAKLQ